MSEETQRQPPKPGKFGIVAGKQERKRIDTAKHIGRQTVVESIEEDFDWIDAHGKPGEEDYEEAHWAPYVLMKSPVLERVKRDDGGDDIEIRATFKAYVRRAEDGTISWGEESKMAKAIIAWNAGGNLIKSYRDMLGKRVQIIPTEKTDDKGNRYLTF